MTSLRCPCGGPAYTRDDLIAMSPKEGGEEWPGEAQSWATYWYSLLGPDDLFCSDEDEVLCEHEVWQTRGLWTPVHDDIDPAELFPVDMELTA